ncbi:MAG: aminotransferase class V-fold PLP-dependent enzyme [Myxococcota bacterium]|nr:aminotransferase class V-fold PLP-dependent enzyme [Myxococcota bacterium]
MIYLDHHAATPLSPTARRAMDEAPFGNPESAHAFGRRARAAVERARRQVAASVGAQPTEVIFTSGGTEACNLAVLGIGTPGRIVSSALEHPAVRAALPSRGVPVVELPLAPGSAPSLATLRAEVREGDIVVLQLASHETGVISDGLAFARAARERGAWLVVDAVAAYGRLPLDALVGEADAVALASHKIGGPAGAGALIVRRGVPLAPQVVGGGQERGRRGGTPDVRALVGFGAAAEDLPTRLATMHEVARRRDRLEDALVALGAWVNGEGPRTASVTHVSLPGWRGAELVAALDLEGLAASAGAACSSGLTAVSPAMQAWFPEDPERGAGTLRLSLGPETTDDDVSRSIEILRRVIARGR